MNTKLLSCAALSATLVSGTAGTVPAEKTVEAQRRMDSTGAGSFHRIGMLREMENTRRNAEKAARAKAVKKTAETKS